MSYIVDFKNVSTAGLETSPVAGTVRGSFFVIKGEYS